ncbi:Fc.00g019160.m01.CDS01 [Cosmosporella sp. VM-42]
MCKSPFYDAFASTRFNISDAREKPIHNVKRRRCTGPLAQKSIVQVESAVWTHLERLVEVLDSNEGREVNISRTMMHLMFDFFCTIFYAQDLNFLGRNLTKVPAETPDGRRYDAGM